MSGDKREESEDKRESIWSVFLRSYIDSFEAERVKQIGQRYRSPRGKGYHELMQRIKRFCDYYGIVGGRRADFINMGRKFSREFWSGLGWLARAGELEGLRKGIDLLLDYLEFIYVKRFGLEPQLVGEFEKLLIEYSLECYNALKILK